MVVEQATSGGPRRLGEYLDCDPARIQDLLAHRDPADPHKRIGEMVVEQSLVSRDRLRDALYAQRCDRLCGCALFEHLEVDDLERLAPCVSEQSAAPGEQFIQQDDAGDCLFVVASGRVVIFRVDEDGEESTLAAAFSGDVIGELAYFTDGTRVASARALEPTELLRLNYADLPHCFRSVPHLARRFLEMLTKRLRDTDVRFQQHVRQRRVAERSLRHLNQYLDLSEAMALGEGIESLISRVVRTASKVMQADRASLFLHDAFKRELWSKVAEGDGVKEIRVPDDKGIVGDVMDNGGIINIVDAYDDPRFNADVDKDTGFRTRSIMAGPVINLEGRVIGVVEVINKTTGSFGEVDEALFRAYCHQASIAVENFTLYNRLMANHGKLAIMMDVATSLSQTIDLPALIQRIVNKICEILTCDRASVFILDASANELWSMEASGTEIEEIRFSATQGLAGAAATQRRVINVADAYEDPRFNTEVDRQTGYRTRTVLCVPLTGRDGQVKGVTQAINRDRGAFDAQDVELLEAVSSQIGVALENAQLFARTVRMRNYLQSVHESISNSILTLDNDYGVVSANRAAADLFEACVPRVSDLAGSDVRQLFAENNDYLLGLIDRVYAGEKSVIDYDIAFAAKQGLDRTVNANAVPLLDHNEARRGLVLVLEDVTEEKRVKSTLTRYMAKEVVERMLNDSERQGLGGVRSNATVVFSDIRGFTTISEGLTAEGTMDFLNEYFTLMVDEVFAQQGVLDKYMGDALLAVFGIPYEQDDDAVRAVRTALNMAERLKCYNVERRTKGLPPVRIGVGINTGEIISGNLGSEKRMDYTVIGDGVNIASRLEGLNKQYGTTLLIGEITRGDIGDRFVVRAVDRVIVKGKTRPLEVYEVLGESGHALTADQRAFEAGYGAYLERDFQGAGERFQQGAAGDPICGVFLERCRQFADDPPPAGWDGVWRARSK